MDFTDNARTVAAVLFKEGGELNLCVQDLSMLIAATPLQLMDVMGTQEQMCVILVGVAFRGDLFKPDSATLRITKTIDSDKPMSAALPRIICFTLSLPAARVLLGAFFFNFETNMPSQLGASMAPARKKALMVEICAMCLLGTDTSARLDCSDQVWRAIPGFSRGRARPQA